MAKFMNPARPLTWLVTGSSSGVGLSLTRRILEQGHKVIATSRNPSRTPDLVREVESQGGRWVTLDLNDKNCDKVIDKLEDEGVAIDVLVNNAGYSVHAVVEGFTEAESRDQMETLFFGPFRLIRAAVPRMRQRRFGVVANVSSAAGLTGRESMGVYGAGKAALDNLTKTLAKEVESFNIRTLTIFLGGFNTNMQSNLLIGEKEMPTDYEGTTAHKFISILSKDHVPMPNNKDKAAKQIFDVVAGQGDGEGHLDEPILPLGMEVPARARLVISGLEHSLEVFEGVANSVAEDKKTALI